MGEGWDEYAEGWDSNSDVIEYSEKAFQSLSRVLDVKDLRVLDFGCGTGLLTEKISTLAKEVVALDTSEKMISILVGKKLSNVIAVSEELTEDMVKENKVFEEKFDLVVASSVCGFLPDLEKTLSVIKSLLKPSGTFIQWDWLSTNGNENSGISRETVENTFSKVGLVPKLIDTPFSMSNSDGEIQVLMGVASNAEQS